MPRLDKPEPRALIGYLVGYDLSNIFRVWLPRENRIISSRDVEIDESQ